MHACHNTALTLFLSCLLFVPSASAEKGGKGTPDALTPAVEDVCDGQTGAAFGLCNAYCEAMDCDSDDPQASEQACGKVDAKYQRITGQIMPCEVCPCASSMTLWQDMLLDPGSWIAGCSQAATDNQPEVFTVVFSYPELDGIPLVTAWEGLDSDSEPEFGCAQNASWTDDPDTEFDALSLTAPEAAACRGLLIETAESVRDIDCPDP